MFCSSLVLRRFCGSAGLCRRFTSGNLLQTYSKISRLDTSFTIRQFCASLVHHNSVVGVTPSQDGAKTQTYGENLIGKSSQNSDHPGNFPDNTKSEAQGDLNNISTAIVATKDKAELSRLRKYINDFFAEYPMFDYDPTMPYTEEFIRMTKMFGWEEDSKEYKTARKRLNTASVLQFNENFDEGSRPKDKKKKPKLEERPKKSDSGGKKKGSKSEDKKSKERAKVKEKVNGNEEEKAKEKAKEREKEKEKEKARREREREKQLRKWIKLFSRIDVKDPVLPTTVRGFKKRVRSVHTNICDVLDADVTGIKSKDWENEVLLSQYTRSTKKIFPRDHPLAGTLLRHLFRHIVSPSETRGFEEDVGKKSN